MHVLTEFRCKHFVSISLKLFGFLVPAQQLLWWYPGQHLASSSYIHYHFLSRGVAFLVWVKKTCWTKYLHRDFKLVRKVCVYLRNILNNFADWKRKCIPASILICFGYWKHWDCLICSSNLWQQMSTHLVWWTSLSNTNTFFLFWRLWTQDQAFAMLRYKYLSFPFVRGYTASLYLVTFLHNSFCK